ncbi:hypothetical protein DBV39_07100 [Orrella marina]|uniref:Uncharacterized protein n=1 Tax=Orrella marina TaxID=2163011 RepID=A0A2R4XIF4_9BURK|nr:hypothetical protein DBV39_07100 [Orrella marina]
MCSVGLLEKKKELDVAGVRCVFVRGAASRQQGQALLECVLVLAILLAAAIWGASQWQGRVANTRIRAMAAWILTIERAIGQDTDFMANTNSGLFDDLAGRGGDTGLASPVALVRALKRSSRLPPGFSEAPPMSYDLALLPVTSGQCAAGAPCVRELLLVLKPVAGLGQADAQMQALDLLMALEGKGAAVLEESANVLRGATIQFTNPLSGHPVLPVGSVGLLLWRSGYQAPYVRLDEDRPVRFRGDVAFDGPVSVTRPLLANGGVVLGRQVRQDDACHPSGLLATLVDGSLVICKSGRWVQDGLRARSFQSCRLSRSRMTLGNELFDFVHPFAGPTRPGGHCECDDGQVPRYLGQDVTMFQGVQVHDGFVCES